MTAGKGQRDESTTVERERWRPNKRWPVQPATKKCYIVASCSMPQMGNEIHSGINAEHEITTQNGTN